MHLVLTITLGEIMVASSVVGSVFLLYTGLVDRLARIETKVDPLWREYLERHNAREYVRT